MEKAQADGAGESGNSITTKENYNGQGQQAQGQANMENSV
jgi:hypothetical protein